MGKANTFGLVGFLALVVVSLSGLLSPACGEVTANGAEETQACAKKACEGDDCPARGHGRGAAGAGGDCSTAKGGSGGTTGGAAMTVAGGAGGAAATDVAEFPCAICRRAENCCRAEGLADCGYTAACTAATDSEKTEFYLVLCRLVLEASSSGSKKPPDVCGF